MTKLIELVSNQYGTENVNSMASKLGVSEGRILEIIKEIKLGLHGEELKNLFKQKDKANTHKINYLNALKLKIQLYWMENATFDDNKQNDLENNNSSLIHAQEIPDPYNIPTISTENSTCDNVTEDGGINIDSNGLDNTESFFGKAKKMFKSVKNVSKTAWNGFLNVCKTGGEAIYVMENTIDDMVYDILFG